MIMRPPPLYLWLCLFAFPLAAQSLVPMTDLGTQTYLGFPGGLYPEGNAMPLEHRLGGLAQAALVRPLDRDGNPDPAGKIVMLSIGMSNTTQEFCSQNNPAPCSSWSFVGQAMADPTVNHSTLVLVNGAKGGQTAELYDSPTDVNYDRIRDTDLVPLGLTEQQVAVGWVKEAHARPLVSLPNANADAYRLVVDLANIARAMKVRYPNLRLLYFSSRIYAGYATTTLNPEPFAYESGFAVKWLIEAQIHQMSQGAIDNRAGDLNYQSSFAPWIAWGPYLWADGMNPRSDGMTWARSDLESDGTHPTQSGEQKVGSLLLAFFKQEPTARDWFLAAPRPSRRRAVRF